MLLRLVRCLWGFRPSWVLLGSSTLWLVCKPPKRRVSLLLPFMPFVPPSFGLSGLVKCPGFHPVILNLLDGPVGGPSISHRLDQVSLDATVFGLLAA